MNRRPLTLVPVLLRAVSALRGPPARARVPRCLLGSLLLGAALLGGCAGSAGPRAVAGGSSTGASHDLPGPLRMRQVALFSNGVGYFEQGGTVPEGGLGSLTFTTAELDDALKSLVIEDTPGSVATLEYPSTLPLQQLLHDSTVDLSTAPSLSDLLDHVRGTRLSLVWHGATLEGTILTVETHTEVGIEGAPTISHETLNLLQDGQCRQVPLSDVEQVRFLDPGVQDALAHALLAIRSARSDQRRTVSVHTTGTGPQQVRIGYVTAAPMWKSSYRLVLAPDHPAQAHLQGWAIVENQSDDDWQHVALSLVSGRPQSFIAPLSQPLLLQRPQVDPAIYASLRPQRYGGGEQLRDQMKAHAIERESVRTSAVPMLSGSGRKRAVAMDGDNSFRYSAPLDLTRSIAVALHSETLADRTTFTVDDVSIPRDRSALLPLMNQPIQAENLSIYACAAGLTHPLRGVLLTNTSAVNLGQGPIAVFDQGGWIGDAQLPDLPAHDHRLLSYAVDLAITVRCESQGPVARTTAWSLAAGILTVTQQLTTTTVYHIDYAHAGPRTLIIAIPRQVGWRLADMPAPFEQTPTETRFRIVLDDHAARTSFTVHARSVDYQQFTLSQLSSASLLDLRTTEQLPEAVVGLLDQITAVRRDMATHDRQLAGLARGVAAYSSDQQRLRSIMPVLDPDRALALRLNTRLSTDETELETRQAAIRALTSERQVLQQRLERLLHTVGSAVEAQ